ncbi:MAG: Holliday junction resolvase RuvX [Sodaliphilus sp.]|nr:Holliday junction resolvase RuvX [Sodaliphilus sp.]
MARIISIDYGKKRTGIAATDPLKLIANPVGTVETKNLISFLKDYLAANSVELIVVGKPSQLNGQPSESMRYITPFVESLKQTFPNVPVVFYDERFTSTIAHQAMIMGGMKKSDRQKKANVDCIAATIILNDYLQSINSKI